MVCAGVYAIMHSLTLVHYWYVHMQNYGITKTQMHNCMIATTMINKTNIVHENDVSNMPLGVFAVWNNQDLPLSQCN